MQRCSLSHLHCNHWLCIAHVTCTPRLQLLGFKLVLDRLTYWESLTAGPSDCIEMQVMLRFMLVLLPWCGVLNNYKAQLKKVMAWNAAGKTLKHVVSRMCNMSVATSSNMSLLLLLLASCTLFVTSWLLTNRLKHSIGGQSFVVVQISNIHSSCRL
jgi:hypothetical protein